MAHFTNGSLRARRGFKLLRRGRPDQSLFSAEELFEKAAFWFCRWVRPEGLGDWSGFAEAEPAKGPARWLGDRFFTVAGLPVFFTGAIHGVAVLDHVAFLREIEAAIAHEIAGLARLEFPGWKTNLEIAPVQLIHAHCVHHCPALDIEEADVGPQIQWGDLMRSGISD